MKIAVIFEGSVYDRKGLMNSALNRVKALGDVSGFQIDTYMLEQVNKGLNKLFRKRRQQSLKGTIEIEEVKLSVLHYGNYFIDNLLCNRLHMPPLFLSRSISSHARLFKDYDCIIAHSTLSGMLAYDAHKKYHIPFAVTWHGTDIHKITRNNNHSYTITAQLLSSASHNYFVSNALLFECQSKFDLKKPCTISYNGVSEKFFRYPEELRVLLKEQFGVQGKKVVAFVGNLVNVKNPMVLPEIFASVQSQYGHCAFWIIGDGYLRPYVERAMKMANLDCKFWGNQPAEMIPDYMNCIDVLVLPSNNESFGMVLLEAIACGANAVGSRRGGIPEVIGDENCFDLGEGFVNSISNRIVHMLSYPVVQIVDQRFRWKVSAEQDYEILLKFCH